MLKEEWPHFIMHYYILAINVKYIKYIKWEYFNRYLATSESAHEAMEKEEMLATFPKCFLNENYNV